MNTKISYMYRDGSNYKHYHSLVVEGAIAFSQIEPYLNDEFFIPLQVGLSDLQPFMRGFPNDDDHAWHTLREEDVAPTEEDPTITTPTAEELLIAFQTVKWDEVEAAKNLGIRVLEMEEK